MDLKVPVPMHCCSLQHYTLLSPWHSHNRLLFLLCPSSFILSGVISNCPPLFPSGHLPTWGACLLVSYLFALCCSCGSHGKNTGVVYHSVLYWTTFCQNSPLWSVRLEWPCTAWLIASLRYTSPLTMTRLSPMKG